MRKHAVAITLVTVYVLALLLLTFYAGVMRPDLIATYGLAEGPRVALTIPLATRIALSTWCAPIVGGVGFCILVGAWSARGSTARTRLLSVGIVWTVFGLALAMGAAYAPVFERLE